MLWLWAILSSAIALIAAVYVSILISNRHVIRLCTAIPKARPSFPLLGNTLLFACSQAKRTRILLDILKETVFKGHRAVCFWFGPHPLVFVTDPNDIRTILGNTVRRGEVLEESSKAYTKYGLLTSPVEHWRVTRRHLNLSFHPRHVEQLMPTFNLASRRLVDDLSGHVDGVDFNLMPHVMSAAVRTICTFLYGQKALELMSTKQFSELLHAIEVITEIVTLRCLSPWLNNETVFNFLYGKETYKVNRIFQSFWHTAITNSARELKEEGKEGLDAENDKNPHTFQTILDSLRELQKSDSTITDKYITEEMISFYGAGTDTIGVTVSSCLLALARFPHIQTRVYEEICAVLTDEDEDVTHSHLKQMTYLERVIKETLRFFNVVPFTVRSTNKDVDLGGYTIPANKLTYLFLSSVCFDPKYFPDPEKFDPDRFSKSNSADDVFIPFSRGMRNCIGKNYAMMLTKVMVVHVLRKYKLSTNMDLQNSMKKYVVVITYCDGYNMSLTDRSK